MQSFGEHLSDDDQFAFSETGDWSQSALGNSGGTPNFVQDAQSGPARLFDRSIAARQAELAKVRHALERPCIGQEKFSAPDRTVRAITGAIPGDTEHWLLQFMFGEASQDMRKMMLDGL